MRRNLEGLKFGLQSYSLRNLSYEKANEAIADLGLSYVEAFPGHLPPEKKRIIEAKRFEQIYNVKVLAYGVNLMPRDESQLRNLFEFAKGLGIEVLTADPEPDSFDLLDELVSEYKTKVAIHNHGPGHRYSRIEDIVKALEGHDEMIGMCMDTGHLARSGEDIVEAAHRLGSRMHGLHIKDVNEGNDDTIVGEGRLPFEDLFRVLKRERILNRCALILEIELEPDNPMPAIRKSVENVRSLLGRAIS